MNAKLIVKAKLVALLPIALLMVSACAATPSPEPTSSSVTTMTKTQRYKASVQTQAAHKNVDVHWVNSPDEGDLARFKDPEETKTSANGSQ